MPTITPKRFGLALVLATMLIAVVVLVGCSGQLAPTPTQVAMVVTEAPTEVPPTAIPPTATVVPPTDTPAPTPTMTAAPTDTPAPTATEAPTAAPTVSTDATNCINCHTDQEALKKLAKKEAPKEKLSEGEG